MGNSSRQRLLLVEDDPELGPMMASVLGEVYDVVFLADGAEALGVARSQPIDVMVVDRRVPGLEGVEVVRALRESGVDTPALVLTALGTVRDKVDGLDAGANDYLVKPFDYDELFARLRALMRGREGEGPVLEIENWTFYPESRAVYSPYGGRAILTPRESELLKLLALHPRKTFTRADILGAVFEASDGPGTVDTYVHYVRRKTDADIITTVRGRGYRVGMP